MATGLPTQVQLCFKLNYRGGHLKIFIAEVKSIGLVAGLTLTLELRCNPIP